MRRSSIYITTIAQKAYFLNGGIDFIKCYNIQMEQENNTQDNSTHSQNDVENNINSTVSNVTTENNEAVIVEKSTKTGSKISPSNAIVIAGVLIALAVIVTGRGSIDGKKLKSGDKLEVKEISETRSLSPVSKTEHIRGDLSKAKVAIVEFSDFQCPYCKAMHPNLLSIMENYGTDVVLVYRHYPLESIHPLARPTAIASECVAEIAGNDGFWKFTDSIFNYTGSGNPLEQTNLETIAVSSGANLEKIKSCVNSGKYDKLIDASIDDGNNAGVQGTPDLTVINLETGEAIHAGADPRALMQILSKILK